MAHYVKNDTNYHGARSKTRVVGNQNSKMQTSGEVKSRTFYSRNERNENGWGTYDNSSTSNYSDVWDDAPYQSSAPANAWGNTSSRKNRKNRGNSGSRTVPLVGNSFSWGDEDFPEKESRPPPVENVWARRKEQFEGRAAMQPTTQTEEERMIQKALELSKQAANEEEFKKRKLEEEYQLQMALLQTDPRLFAEFQTDEELAEVLKPEVPEYLLNEFGDFPNEYNEGNNLYNAQNHVEDDWSQKKDKRLDSKTKISEYQCPDDIEYQEQIQNDWPPKKENKKSTENKKKYPELVEYRKDIQSNVSLKKDKNSDNKNEMNEPQDLNDIEYQDCQSSWSPKENKKSDSKDEMNEPQNLNDIEYQDCRSSWFPKENKKSGNINEPVHLDQDAQSIWSLKENKKTDENKQYYDDIESQESVYSNQAEDIKNKKQINKKEGNKSQFPKENFALSSANFNSVRASSTSTESKSCKSAKPKISKVIDIFGGWSSKISQTSNIKSSHPQEHTESNHKFTSAKVSVFGGEGSKISEISNVKSSHPQEHIESSNKLTSAKVSATNDVDFPNDLDAYKQVPDSKEGLKFNNHCMKDNSENHFKSNKDGYSSFKSGKLPNSNDISHLPNDYNWSENSDTFSASQAVSFLEDTEKAPEIDSKKHNYYENKMFYNLLRQEIDSKKGAGSLINSIIDDYSALAVNCSDSSMKEKFPISAKPKDNFTISSQNNQEGFIFDQGNTFEFSRCISQNISSKQESNLLNSFDRNQYDISQHFPIDAITETEDTSLSRHFTQMDLSSSKIPNGNVSVSEDVFKISPPSNCDINRVSDNEFSLPLFKEPVRDISNSEGINSNDPPIPAPVPPETMLPHQPNPMMPNLMNPNAMMAMNPLLMQHQMQMMMFTRPFFFQQLQQMQMFAFQSMSVLPNQTLQSPLMLNGPPFANVQQAPILSNSMYNVSDIEQASNVNPFPQQDIRICSPLQPPQLKTDSESLCHAEPTSHKNALTPPGVEFENSWLREIYSEGVANMNESSFIPPPKGPTTNPVAATHASFVEKEMDLKASQSASEFAFRNGNNTQHSDWAMKSLENPSGESATVDNIYQQQSENTCNGYVAGNESQEEANECIGWGDIDNGSEKKVSSWNEDVDGWGDERGLSAVRSMRDSSRYALQKESSVRQPTSQPFFGERRR